MFYFYLIIEGRPPNYTYNFMYIPLMITLEEQHESRADLTPFS